LFSLKLRGLSRMKRDETCEWCWVVPTDDTPHGRAPRGQYAWRWFAWDAFNNILVKGEPLGVMPVIDSDAVPYPTTFHVICVRCVSISSHFCLPPISAYLYDSPQGGVGMFLLLLLILFFAHDEIPNILIRSEPQGGDISQTLILMLSEDLVCTPTS
jgi:hypothetical protein